MAAGTATLSYVRENRLAERAGVLGSRLLGQLQGLAREFPIVGDVRGRGPTVGIELVEEKKKKKKKKKKKMAEAEAEAEAEAGVGAARAGVELAAVVQRECLRRGLIVELGGRQRNVVRLLPPLTITDEQASAVMDRLADAVETVARNHTHGDQAPQQR